MIPAVDVLIDPDPDPDPERVAASDRDRGREPWASSLMDSARRLAAGVLGGLVTGLAIGGVGGRVAMFVLRLTSSPTVIGLKTDDDFTIGRFSGDTGFLLAFTAGLGVLGSLFYLAVRALLPAERRPLLMAIVGGTVGGALFVRPGGVDFTLLSPLPLAIPLFVALPAAYGAILSLVVERWLREDSPVRRSRLGVLGLIPLLLVSLVGPLGALIVPVILGAWMLARAYPSSIAAWRSRPATWVGRAALAGLTGFALIDLIRDAVEIL